MADGKREEVEGCQKKSGDLIGSGRIIELVVAQGKKVKKSVSGKRRSKELRERESGKLTTSLKNKISPVELHHQAQVQVGRYEHSWPLAVQAVQVRAGTDVLVLHMDLRGYAAYMTTVVTNAVS